MKIFRIETPVNHRGPWNPTPKNTLALLFEGDDTPAGVSPAGKADIVAKATRYKMPSEMPRPDLDGISFDHYGHRDAEFYSGFASIAQYREWFTTTAIRRALYMDHDVQLTCYEVSKKDVKIGEHQVVFRLSHAALKYVFTEKEAIQAKEP